jgi:pilus assembly protein CpaE
MVPPKRRGFVGLPAVLIAPDRQLAEQFRDTLSESGAFQILADLERYPTEQTLEIRLKQLKPEAVLVDFSTDRAVAEGLIRFMMSFQPAVHVIGLDRSSNSDAALGALKLGASEFLSAPFDPEVQREAVAGILRLRCPQGDGGDELGRIVAFSSAKPGSGASMLACQTALHLRRSTGSRILLADMDLTGGTAGYYLHIKHSRSMLDALERVGYLDAAEWASLVAHSGGVDVLPAPAAAHDLSVDPERCREVLESVRRLYDWVILDLPAIFYRASLQAIADSDCVFLVTTPELPCLHLARKAVSLLAQYGIGKDRLRVLVNRMTKGGGVDESDLEKILNSPVQRCFPNDYVSLHRTVALGGEIDAECALGKAIEDFTGRLAGVARNEKRGASPMFDARLALAEI